MFQSECGPDFLESLHLSYCSWCERAGFCALGDIAAPQQHGGGSYAIAMDKGLRVVSGGECMK